AGAGIAAICPYRPLRASCGGFLRSSPARILRRISTLIPYTHPAEDFYARPLRASCGGFLRSFRTRILRRISTLIPYTHPAEDFYAHSVHASCGGFLRSFPTSYGSLKY